MAKINPAGSALVYSTYLGGSSFDWGSGIALDTAGNAYIAGYTSSFDFPTTGSIQPNLAGFFDALLSRLWGADVSGDFDQYLLGVITQFPATHHTSTRLQGTGEIVPLFQDRLPVDCNELCQSHAAICSRERLFQ